VVSGELVSSVRLEFLSWLAGSTGAHTETLEQDVDDCHTVKELLVQLAQAYPEFERSVFHLQDLSLNASVAIFVNDSQIELENGLETKLRDGDTLVFVPLISGGC
jgi:sulfur-carrier protein